MIWSGLIYCLHNAPVGVRMKEEEKKIPQSVIARLLNVHRLTVRNYILTRKLQQSAP